MFVAAERWPMRAADESRVNNDMGSRVPASSKSQLLSSILYSRTFSSRIACAGLAALIVMFGNRGLETAAANGDTRTLTLHHLHTDENITITFKRDGRYDESALKKLDRFLRDWRKDEEVHMDPLLFDVIWEASREAGGDRVIQVVCGYRAPATNAMLRRRSGGVAEFSQHTLGKAMDFYISGVSLEEIREAGLRLQRGGVGYYPTSGSPFVHLDVGSVRHWPRMTREQLVRVFPNGRTVHVPSDGQPLSGYALALADIQRRGSSAPSQMSLAAAQSSGVDTSAARNGHSKNLFASLFHLDEEEDGKQQAPPAAASSSRFSLASLPDAKATDAKAEPARTAPVPVPVARPQPQRTALAAAVASAGNGDNVTASAERDQWTALAGLAEPSRPPAGVTHAPMSNPGRAPAAAPWPARESADRVPLDMVLAYAGQPQQGDAADFESRFGAVGPAVGRGAASSPTRSVAQRVVRDNTEAARKKVAPVRTAASVPVVRVKPAEAATPGMRYDDPWLRAVILAPQLYGSMTATLHGDPDFSELRSLMSKPTSAVAMSFAKEPYPGISANNFSGEAVVFLTTYVFSQRTAWLQ
jgi:uncharacterized protein YcbK (DUF882 family)